MKRNWIQIVTLILCVVLLIIVIVQGKRIEELNRKIDSRMDYVDRNIENEMDMLADYVSAELDRSEKLVAEYDIQPAGIDSAEKSLIMDVSVKLKQWHDDTAVNLICGQGTQPVAMKAVGNGVYSARVSLPVKAEQDLVLEAAISGGGMTKLEELDTWDHLLNQLPLHYFSGSWSGPDYREGVVSSQFDITIRTQNGYTGAINNPRFLVYRNEELVQTIPAVPFTFEHLPPADGQSFAVCESGQNWELECGPEDKIVIRFRCEDDFGLGYDFLFANWVSGDAAGAVPEHEGIAESGLLLYWPE